MMTRCAPICRSKGMENSAFSRVVCEPHSSVMTFSGTPSFSSSFSFDAQSPFPLTRISGASPCLNNSAARSGLSVIPPPKTTIASAFTGPLSTVSTCWGKNHANTPSAISTKLKAMASLKNRRWRSITSSLRLC